MINDVYMRLLLFSAAVCPSDFRKVDVIIPTECSLKHPFPLIIL
uniref:Uncharacterized protein n=1 Tax=Anguilla anguilla TaxID=7936 RepID=A0A0E9WAA7_ANGAN